MKPIGIGMLGFGSMGKLHTLAWRSLPSIYPDMPPFRLEAVCTSSAASAEAALREGGFHRSHPTIEDLVADPAISVIDCVLPNDAHRAAITAALSAGKHIYCEKPLALSGAEAREIAALAGTSAGRLGLTFNYRFLPAILRAKRLLEEGTLGEIYSFEFEYLHSGYQDASRPLSWRMRRESSGGGALVDLGAHSIDLARHLLGEFAELSALTQTWVLERPLSTGAAEKGPVTVDDAAWLTARLASGAIGTLVVSRFATGAADDLRFRIEGARGALRFDLMDANWLYYYDATRPAADRGWTRLETIQNYPGASVPPARAIVGWERSHAENQYRFLAAVAEGKEPSPGIADGLAVNLITDAAYEAAREGGWVSVPRA
ncbi:MAG TPA: Gfo/Idh/MocA family oxidoreductase [Rectinemataceae bacterium]|nr:Gfo/Idh/MocA family oxidoreductase [Rectinemataceae bacterium]